MVQKWTSQQIEERVRALGQWFHNLDLNGVQTAPQHFLGDFPRVFWRYIEGAVPDLHGKSVLDVGCNGGFYSIEARKRGARRVVGIDVDDRYLNQARFAAEVLGFPDIEFRRMTVYDVAKLGERFDVVIFMGVLYHLRHPLLALDLLHDHVVGDLMLFQTMIRGGLGVEDWDDDYAFNEETQFDSRNWPKLQFIEKNYSGDPSNWWVPNRAAVEAMLRSSGFAILDHPHTEVFICRQVEKDVVGEDTGAIYPARGRED